MPEYLAKTADRAVACVLAKDDDSARLLVSRKLIAENRLNDYNDWIEHGMWIQYEKSPPDDLVIRSGFSVRG